MNYCEYCEKEELRVVMVGRARHPRVWAQHRRWNDAKNPQMCETERATRMRLLYCLSVVACCLYVY